MKIRQVSPDSDNRIIDRGTVELLKLPLVRFAPFMAAGMLLGYFGGSVICAIVFACAAAFIVYLAVKRKKAELCVIGFAAGLLVSGLYLRVYCEPILEYSGKTIRGEFIVREITYVSGDSQRVTAGMKLGGRTAKVSLSCESGLAVGQRVAADIELGEYDEERRLYDLANGILLSGSAENVELLPGGAKSAGVLKTLRSGLIGAVEQVFFGDERSLVLAMLFGEDHALPQAMRERLRICGAAHFTAVSGTHFAVFGAVLMALLPKEGRARGVFSLIFAPLAVIFFGTSASVLRAAVMFFINGMAVLFRRKGHTLNTLCAAFIMIALASPGIILDAGFAMSALGVFGVGVVGVRLSERICEQLPKKAGFLKAPITVITVSISAVICTAPISAAVFKGVSLFGAVSSVLLMTLMTVGAVFGIIGGVTGSALLAVPAAYVMRAADQFIEFFGGKRGLWLTLDFDGAWVLTALVAVLLTVAAFASPKALILSVSCMAALAAVLVGLSFRAVESRSEIRFVGSSRSGAAIVLDRDRAAVVISGSGAGLAEKISRCLRECGARKISVLMADEADFVGALAIKELSELVEIERICSTPVAAAVLSDKQVEIISKDSVLNVSGVTIAAAHYSESNINADIAVCYGSFRSVPESEARLAVYFSGFERELPENGVNAGRDGVVIALPGAAGKQFVVS